MPKIIINSSVISADSTELIHAKKAILNDRQIKYNYDDINVLVNIKEDSVTLRRYNDEMDITLNFKRNNKLEGSYIIKSLNLKINILVYTKKLIINKKNIHINYDLYMNNEYSNNFTYDLEWRDYNASEENN